jgi:RNA polymerase sigma-70 factor (ECF subfamily)
MGVRNTALALDDDNVVAFPGGRADEVDIGRLFDEHAPYLCRVVHRLTGSREAAEDVVQEVFVLAWHRRAELEDRTGIRTWLYRVAVNHVRHRRRSFARYQGLLDRYKSQPEPMRREDSPLEVTSRAERGKLIQECVKRLSDKQREVFVLYELEEIEGAEIAEILDIPVNTVWSRLRLARAAFRAEWSTLVEVEESR